jgi:hypothetical protein
MKNIITLMCDRVTKIELTNMGVGRGCRAGVPTWLQRLARDIVSTLMCCWVNKALY